MSSLIGSLGNAAGFLCLDDPETLFLIAVGIYRVFIDAPVGTGIISIQTVDCTLGSSGPAPIHLIRTVEVHHQKFDPQNQIGGYGSLLAIPGRLLGYGLGYIFMKARE